MPVSCPYCKSKSAEPCSGETEISFSNVLGPSIEEVVVCLLFLLAYKLCENLGIVHKPNVKGTPCDDDKKGKDMKSWLSDEIKELTLQLSMLGYDLNEPGICPTPSMFQARKFVLNRLAEIMEKKDELDRTSSSTESGSTFSVGDSLCS